MRSRLCCYNANSLLTPVHSLFIVFTLHTGRCQDSCAVARNMQRTTMHCSLHRFRKNVPYTSKPLFSVWSTLMGLATQFLHSFWESTRKCMLTHTALSSRFMKRCLKNIQEESWSGQEQVASQCCKNIRSLLAFSAWMYLSCSSHWWSLSSRVKLLLKVQLQIKLWWLSPSEAIRAWFSSLKIFTDTKWKKNQHQSNKDKKSLLLNENKCSKGKIGWSF